MMKLDQVVYILENQVTDEGNTPSDDLMCVKLSPGKAYVRGYDVSLPGTTVIDVEKPRDCKTIKNASIPFSMGSLIKVNNVLGAPYINLGGNNTNVVDLIIKEVQTKHWHKDYKLEKQEYILLDFLMLLMSGASTPWDLHLYDIQTFTILKCTDISDNVVQE